MGKLAKGKVGFSVFLAPNGVGTKALEAMAGKSASDVVCDIAPVHGWSGWDKLLERELAVGKMTCGGFHAGQLVVKKRTPPASAVKAETEALVEAESLASGGAPVNLARRQEIRVEVTERLAKETPVSYKAIEWAYLPVREQDAGGYVVATATSDSDIDRFVLAWHDTTGEMLRQVTFDDTLARAGIDSLAFDGVAFANEADLFTPGISTEFMLWFWYRAAGVGGLSANGAMQAGESISLSLTDAKGSTVVVNGQAHRNIGEIREMVRRGYGIARMALMCEINRVGVEFMLGADSSYYAVDIDGVTEMSKEGAFAERMEVLCELVGTIGRIVVQYGNLRKDTKAWKKEAKEFQQWLKGGAK